MKHRRSYLDAIPDSGREFELESAEREHLIRALRLKAGDEFVVFDGKGYVARAHLQAIGRREAIARVLAPAHLDLAAELPRPLAIAVAVPRPNRQEAMVRGMVELGVTTIVALDAMRTRSTAREASAVLSRWQRYAVEAGKQCGRNRLPGIISATVVELAARIAPPAKWLLLAPDAEVEPLRCIHENDAAIGLIVGPEGGFESEETQKLVAAGAQKVSLGAPILRIETAALASTAIAAASMRAVAMNSRVESATETHSSWMPGWLEV